MGKKAVPLTLTPDDAGNTNLSTFSVTLPLTRLGIGTNDIMRLAIQTSISQRRRAERKLYVVIGR